MVPSVYFVDFVLDFLLNLLLVELSLHGLILNTTRRLEQRHRHWKLRLGSETLLLLSGLSKSCLTNWFKLTLSLVSRKSWLVGALRLECGWLCKSILVSIRSWLECRLLRQHLGAWSSQGNWLVLHRLGCQAEGVRLSGCKTSFTEYRCCTETRLLLVEHRNLTLKTRGWLKSSLLLGRTEIWDLILLAPLRLLWRLELWLEAGRLDSEWSRGIKRWLYLLLLKWRHTPLRLLLCGLLENLGSESGILIIKSEVWVIRRHGLSLEGIECAGGRVWLICVAWRLPSWPLLWFFLAFFLFSFLQ